MAGRADPLRYRSGYVEIDTEGLLFRKSPRYFLANQRVRWRKGGTSRVKAAGAVFGVMAAPIVVVWSVVYALQSPLFTTVDRALVVFPALVTIIALWNQLFRNRRVPFDRLEDGITVQGPRSLRLSPGALSWWRSLGDMAEGQKVTFLDTTDRNRAVRSLERHGVDIDYDTRAKYKLFKNGGGYFCPACDSRVSPSDTSCSACGDGLTTEETIPAWDRRSVHVSSFDREATSFDRETNLER